MPNFSDRIRALGPDAKMLPISIVKSRDGFPKGVKKQKRKPKPISWPLHNFGMIQPIMPDMLMLRHMDEMARKMEIPRHMIRGGVQRIGDEIVMRREVFYDPELGRYREQAVEQRNPEYIKERCPNFESFCRQYYNVKRSSNELDKLLPHRIGSGHFSSVYACPWDNTKVVKVSRARPRDDGWLEYAAFSIEHQYMNNPLLIKLHGLRVFHSSYVAVLDRFDRTVHRIDGPDVPFELWERIAAICAVFPDRLSNYRRAEPCEEYELHAHRLRAALRRKGLRPDDVHGDNVMVNIREAQVVITDPIGCSSRGDTLQILRHLGIGVEM